MGTHFLGWIILQIYLFSSRYRVRDSDFNRLEKKFATSFSLLIKSFFLFFWRKTIWIIYECNDLKALS